tara:strand:- start:25 stop:768 length:744 start_codon:yes stop_codon:yes gene_type:complete
MDSLFITNIEFNEHNIEKKEYVIDNTDLIIFKNFLSEKDYNTCVNILLYHLRTGKENDSSINISKESVLHYGHSSIGWHPTYIPHWNYILTDNDFFRVYIFSKIQSIYEWTKELEVKRIYCSFQTAEQFGNWHYDDNSTDAFTFVLYCNITRDMIGKSASGLDDNSNEVYVKFFDNQADKKIIDDDDDDDGYFHIKYDKEPIRVIRTSNNSAVLFNSTILHLGDCPKYNSSSLRCVIAFKLSLPKKE